MIMRRLLALTLCGGLFAVPAAAHEKLRMAITVDPVEPIVAEQSTITIKLTSVTGSPVTGHEKPLELIADMTGHPMTPVKALLAPTTEPGVFSGPIEFTMAGMWRLTVVIEDKPAPMRAIMAVHVGTGEPESTTDESHAAAAASPGGATRPAKGTQVVDVESAPMPTFFNPWSVVYVVVGLLVATEALAGVALVRRRRRAQGGAIAGDALR